MIESPITAPAAPIIATKGMELNSAILTKIIIAGAVVKTEVKKIPAIKAPIYLFCSRDSKKPVNQGLPHIK